MKLCSAKLCSQYRKEGIFMSKEQITKIRELSCQEKTNDARMLALATKRMTYYDPSTLISCEEMDHRLGITEDDLLGWEDIEIE